MQKIKIGDKVKILIGKDKGREGKVERVLVKKGTLVLPGLNMYKKHTKGLTGDQKGGIYDVSRPVGISKVSLICPNCNKAARVGFKFVGKDKKRICKKCGREIDKEGKSKDKK